MIADENRREELRGLFALGMLAVLTTYRLNGQKLIVSLYGSNPIDLTFLIDLTIVFWLMYGFCMVIAYSNIDELSPLFYTIANIMMYMSILLVLIITSAFVISIHEDRKNYIVMLLYIFAGLTALVNITDFIVNRKNRINKKNKIKISKKALSQILFVIFLLVLMFLLFLPTEYKEIVNYLFYGEFIIMFIIFLLRIWIVVCPENEVIQPLPYNDEITGE